MILYTFKIPTALLEALREHRKLAGVSVSEAIRRGILMYLEHARGRK
jgi:hypothetical protein